MGPRVRFNIWCQTQRGLDWDAYRRIKPNITRLQLTVLRRQTPPQVGIRVATNDNVVLSAFYRVRSFVEAIRTFLVGNGENRTKRMAFEGSGHRRYYLVPCGDNAFIKLSKFVSTGRACLETYPCRHDVEYEDEDGDLVSLRMGGRAVYTLLHHLEKENICQIEDADKEHFEEYSPARLRSHQSRDFTPLIEEPKIVRGRPIRKIKTIDAALHGRPDKGICQGPQCTLLVKKEPPTSTKLRYRYECKHLIQSPEDSMLERHLFATTITLKQHMTFDAFRFYDGATLRSLGPREYRCVEFFWKDNSDDEKRFKILYRWFGHIEVSDELTFTFGSSVWKPGEYKISIELWNTSPILHGSRQVGLMVRCIKIQDSVEQERVTNSETSTTGVLWHSSQSTFELGSTNLEMVLGDTDWYIGVLYICFIDGDSCSPIDHGELGNDLECGETAGSPWANASATITLSSQSRDDVFLNDVPIAFFKDGRRRPGLYHITFGPQVISDGTGFPVNGIEGPLKCTINTGLPWEPDITVQIYTGEIVKRNAVWGLIHND